jgi:hypothetical protein
MATPLFVALCAGCSAESPNQDAMMTGIGTGGTAGAAAGTSGGAGQFGVPSGAAGIGGAGIGGSNGTAGSAGGSGGASGGSGQAGSAGASGIGGSGGIGAAGSAAGTGGQAGDAGSAGTAGAAGSAAGAGGDSSSEEGCEVSPITDDMRDEYENMNDPYYVKYASANGIIVATGPGVDDEAIIRYCRLLKEMYSNEEVHAATLADKMWFTMIAEDEQLSSLPQIDRTYGTSLNRRARGLGGLTPTICAEDSIMCMPGDPWVGDCICPHETGHTLYSSGIARVPELSSRLTAITDAARSSGRIANSYVWQDGDESGMMAWGVQVWYDCAINGTEGAYHPDINTRAELQREMPDFYEFLSDLLPADNEYEDCYANP